MDINFDKILESAAKKIEPAAREISDKLEVSGISIVGGAVRDTVLGRITNRKFSSKDFDIIAPYPPHSLDKNKNVLWYRKNSLGGIKLELKGVGKVDIFQYYTDDVPAIIANYFDFNCNSLYYSKNYVIPSLYFLHFIQTGVLRTCNSHMGKLGDTVARALKFQIEFSDKFGIDIKLDDKVSNDIGALSTRDERDMKKYVHDKINSKSLQNKVLDSYAKYQH